MKEELAYWMALAHLPGIKIARKNKFIVSLFEKDMSVIDFFSGGKALWQNSFGLEANEIELLEKAMEELASYSFLVEDLLEQGYSIIPITSPDYSPWLKKNLKRTYSPPLIYTKGNKQILKKDSIAIVGARKANKNSLLFTDNIAKEASENNKAVVSGFAHGVDKKALDSAIHYKGQSIIVLPQGITTFQSGYKKYYKQIISGDVLVLSTYYPKSPWSTAFAMGRNPIIYGLANEIFIAESGETGGTWSGAIDGLKRGRKIYMRIPSPKEKNANDLLIQSGAIAVDNMGKEIENYLPKHNPSFPKIIPQNISKATTTKILRLLSHAAYTTKEIIEKLELDVSPRKLITFLQDNDKVTLVDKKSPMKFTLMDTDNKQQTLF